MKILFVSTIGSPWGGSEELWSQTALRLLKDGISISASLGSYANGHPKVSHLIDNGIRVNFRNNPITDAICLGLEKFSLSSLRNSLYNSFEKHILNPKPDLVVFNQATCYGAYPLMLFCKAKSIKYISLSQLNTEYGWPNDNNAYQIAKAFHSAEACFFVSKSNLELFQIQIAERLSNAYVIPNPFNFREIPALDWPTDETINIAHVARLDFTHKGTDILLRSFAGPKWKDRNFKLNIYGKGNILLAKKLADFVGTHNYTFKGHQNGVEEIWKENHLLVLSSRYEGMPLSLIEAMFCGRPAVVTDVAGHSELIQDGVNGFVAKAPTLTFLNDALEKAWDSRTCWYDMGQHAKKTIHELYSEDPVGVFYDHILNLIHRK